MTLSLESLPQPEYIIGEEHPLKTIAPTRRSFGLDRLTEFVWHILWVGYNDWRIAVGMIIVLSAILAMFFDIAIAHLL